MKKIMIFMFCVNLAFFLFSGVQIFSVAFEQQTLAGKASILIQKDQHTTTTEHLTKIEAFFDREGADIFFRTPDLAGIYPTWIYYATDNTSRIFPGFLEGGRYDSFTEQFGFKIPAMGFSVELDELMKYLYKEGM